MNLEAALCALYAEEARLYADALGIAEGLAGRVDEESRQADVARIVSFLDQVQELEAGRRSVHEQWRQEHRAPGPDLRGRLDAVAALIQKLQAVLGGALDDAKRSKVALAPRLEAVTRQERGRRAYRSAMWSS